MKNPIVHQQAYDWMIQFHKEYPDIYFQFRKKDSRDHTMRNGYYFAGADDYASVGLTEETFTRAIHSITVLFKKNRISLNEYEAEYDELELKLNNGRKSRN